MAQGYFLLVLMPVFGMLGNVLSHIFISRVKRGKDPIKCLFYGFCCGMFFILILSVLIYFRYGFDSDSFFYILLNIVAYFAMAYSYFHFVNINVASLRIRILQEIIESPGGVSQERLLNRYNAKNIIDNRIERFVGSGQLMEKHGVYYLGKNRSFLSLFWLFETLKIIFLGRGNRLLNEPLPKGGIVVLFWQNQFFRFLLIGGVNTVFGYGVYALLVLLRIDYRLALTISTILAVLFNYQTNGRLVFRNAGSKVFLKFIILNIAMYILNQALLISLVSFNMDKLLSQAIIVPIVIMSSFIINKTWVFRKGNRIEAVNIKY